MHPKKFKDNKNKTMLNIIFIKKIVYICTDIYTFCNKIYIKLLKIRQRKGILIGREDEPASLCWFHTVSHQDGTRA